MLIMLIIIYNSQFFIYLCVIRIIVMIDNIIMYEFQNGKVFGCSLGIIICNFNVCMIMIVMWVKNVNIGLINIVIRLIEIM